MQYTYQLLRVLFIVHSTQILKVLQKLMPLLRVCIKALKKNEYLEIFKITFLFLCVRKTKR